MPLGIDPKVDYAFKKLFGSLENKPLLIDLLQAILNETVEGVEILNPFNAKETEEDKLSILDIKAQLKDQRLVNIEMQMVVSGIYPNRALYYWSRIHSQQLQEGEDYNQLKPTISIHILGDFLFRDLPEYHLQFALREAKHRELLLTNHLQMHIIELPKFTLSAEQLDNEFQKWCYFLIHGEELEPKALPKNLKNPSIEKAVEVLEIMTHNDLERERYEARLKAQRDESSLKTSSFQEGKIEGERIGIQKGEQIGIQKGEQIGIQKGEQIGIQKGEQIGLLEAIEGLLEVRFGEEGLQFMSQVRLLSDLAPLRQLQQTLRKHSSIEEFRQLLNSLSSKISN
jgi:predicted transposase/invertase (TIGR01784 family)